MSAADDDDLEGDEKLTSMRAVWLSMRDEEPSDKGLAALMAAAREKADVMKEAEAKPEESWWQKVLAVFRRPPVLALASVTILLGGALVVANRSDKMAVDQTAKSPEAAQNAAPAPDVDRRAEMPSAATGAGSATRDLAAPGSAAAAAPVVEAPPASPEMNQKTDAPVKRRPAREKREETWTTEPVKKAEELSPPPPPPPPPAEPEATVTDAAESRAPVTRGATTKPRPEPTSGGIGATDTTAMPTGESMGGDVKAKDDAASGRAQSRVLQLVKQCETAAARGDCAAVKVMAARIRSEDAGVYKARVVKNASIARCLE